MKLRNRKFNIAVLQRSCHSKFNKQTIKINNRAQSLKSPTRQ